MCSDAPPNSLYAGIGRPARTAGGEAHRAAGNGNLSHGETVLSIWGHEQWQEHLNAAGCTQL